MIAVILYLLLLGGFFALAWRDIGPATRLLVIYLPVQLAFNILPGVDLASSRVLSLALGAAWLLSKLQASSFKIQALKLPYLLPPIFYLLFLLWAFVSLIGVFPYAAGLRKLAFWLSYLPLFIVALDTHRDRLNRYPPAGGLASAVAISGTLAAVIALIPQVMSWSAGWRMGAGEAAQWWLSNISPHFIGATVAQSVGEYPSWFAAVGFTDVFRAVGTFPDPHMLAFFLELTIPITIAVAINRISQYPNIIISKVFWFLSALLQLTILFLTFSRGAYVGIAVAAVAAAIFIGFRLFAPGSKFKYAALGVLGVAVIGLALWHTPIASRLTDLADRSTEGRLALWQTAYETTLSHPVRGVGLGNFPYEVDPTADYRTPIYAHNLYLDISSELGFVGLALWLLLVLPGIAPLVNPYFVLRSPYFYINAAAAISLVAFSVHGLFDTPLFSPQVFPLLLTLLALP